MFAQLAGAIMKVNHLVRFTVKFSFIAMGLLLFELYILHWRQHDIQTHLPAKPPLFLKTKDCSRLLECLTDGAWNLKMGISKEMIFNRKKVEMSIFEDMGWPQKLYRDDHRCGANFPLPGTSTPSLCDEYGPRPCCNENTGRCGSLSDSCSCPECTDFTHYFSAELAEWKPAWETCPFQYLQQGTACEIFARNHITDLVFVGDSLMRHFFAALAILITNDPVEGALNKKLEPEERKPCHGEMQFVDRGTFNCHGKTIHRWEEFNQSQVCFGDGSFKTRLVEAYAVPHAHRALEAVQELLGKRGSVAVLSVGLHMNLNSQVIIEQYFGPIVKEVENKGNGWPLLIWINIHRVSNYLKSDTERLHAPIITFNAEMTRYCERKSIPVLQASRLTAKIKSYDGRHFGLGGNMAKVQVLLNYLKTRFELCSD